MSCRPGEVVRTTPDTVEPIAYIGHGGFFGQDGRQIVPTAEFVDRAQGWYRRKLLAGLDPAKQREFDTFRRRLTANVKLGGQARLVVQQRELDWLIANSPELGRDGRTLGKLRALKYELNWVLPTGEARGDFSTGQEFRLDPELERKLNAPDISPDPGPVFLATVNLGKAYIDECALADVPIPPAIGVLDPNGLAGWKTQGFIPTNEQFITGTPAELRTFENAKGMCIALPRYTGSSKTTVKLDGVICLSKISSKVCIWDNQRQGQGFNFPAGDQIPIGVKDLNVNPGGLYQAGGFELENGSGGICTDCHAGENPYIIHPNADLGGGLAMGALKATLPMFAPNRYIPLVPASWPQNAWSQDFAFVPTGCRGCHVKGDAGRFPHLSNELKRLDPVTGDPLEGYCNTILRQAIVRTMPQGNAGSLDGTQPLIDFEAWCDLPPTSSTADEGDPHLTTTNGIRYDFQAAGEFTSLLQSDTGFELQTRQTPVLTSFVPGANAYTGLASCVSLNTAAALRVGAHRISYQPSPRGPSSAEQMQLRIDGRLVTLPPNGINLGNGDMITTAAPGGGLDIRLADGTRLLISPNFWASEGYWYLNIQVLDTRAREGTMGHILASNWLPLARNGSSFGPAPVSLGDRHILLNQRFADAWRVTSATSLFDYAPGTSTASFTDRSWPPPSGAACTKASTTPWGPGPARPPVQPMRPEEAQRLCRPIRDKAAFEDCVFDMVAMADPGVAEAYGRTQAWKRNVAGGDRTERGYLTVRPDRPAAAPSRKRRTR